MALAPHYLPEGIRSNVIPVRDLQMHYLEAGDREHPLLLLLHGFPELSYSWRKLILPLASSDYHVVAPDQRGYGRTESRTRHENGLSPFRLLNLVHDIVALVFALGHTSAAAVVGHDFGSPIAALSALIRPELFAKVVMMSAPFSGVPTLPFNVVNERSAEHNAENASAPSPKALDSFLASMSPPRKHYTSYFSTQHANEDMLNASGGLHNFLRAYFHIKSADWPLNNPCPLTSIEPSQIAKLPPYYLMPINATMPDVVAPHVPSPSDVAKNRWLPDDELAVYMAEFGRTGFQGGLNWYAAARDPSFSEQLSLFSGKKIEVPAMFLAGEKDWGTYQIPGAVGEMRETCPYMKNEYFILVPNAGHWVQQERFGEVLAHLTRFLVQSSVV